MSKYDVSASAKILAPEGMHNARLVRFLELGTQETDYGDKFQCMISFELVDESAVFNEENGEQNFVVHRKYSRSLKPRSDMGKVVRAILGDDLGEGDLEMDDVLDGTCQVEIKHTKDGKYANIISVKPPTKGKIAKSESETQSLYLDKNFDQDVFDGLPDWLQDIIRESDEYKECVEEGWAEEEDEKPKKKGKRSKDDDDDEEDEDDSPRGRKSKRKDDEDEEDDEDERPAKNRRKNVASKRATKKSGRTRASKNKR